MVFLQVLHVKKWLINRRDVQLTENTIQAVFRQKKETKPVWLRPLSCFSHLLIMFRQLIT